MARDAPDYTLLSDVEITGTEIMVAMDLQGATIAMPIDVQGATIALPVDIQGQTINLDVNLVASTVTIDVNISAQTVDVKIYTPSGRWVSSSDLLTSTTSYVATNIPSGAEQTVLTLSGRGRLKSIGFYFARTDPNGDVYTQTRIRVYIDGETDPSVNVSPANIDDFMGRLLLRQLQFDYETVVPATGTKAAFAQVTSPVCGLTNIWYDEDSQKYKVSGGFLVLNTEFLSSAEVKIYNGSGGPIEARMLIFYGEYV